MSTTLMRAYGPDDTLLVIANLDGDLYSNRYWKWCEDGDGDTGTYDEFEYGPDFMLAEGDTLRMDYLWGWRDAGGISAPADYQLTVPKAMDIKTALAHLLAQYHADEQMQKSSGRFFYIEGVVRDENGDYLIEWGT